MSAQHSSKALVAPQPCSSCRPPTGVLGRQISTTRRAPRAAGSRARASRISATDAAGRHPLFAAKASLAPSSLSKASKYLHRLGLADPDITPAPQKYDTAHRIGAAAGTGSRASECPTTAETPPTSRPTYET